MVNDDKIKMRIEIGNLIKYLRNNSGLSVDEFSKKIDIKENTLQRIEQGKFSIDADLLFIIFKKLNCSVGINGKDLKL